MKTLEETITHFQNSVKKDQVWAIFDVDRVMINTTSWYQACMTPDLLIEKANVAHFKEINDNTYSKFPSLTQKQFREQTLKLLTKKTNEQSFFDAGYFIASKVTTYKEPIQYIKYLSKFYGDRIHILFLSAGYKPFMNGVVEKILSRENLTELKYQVIGSGILFDKKHVKETFHCYGKVKQKIVQKIIDKKALVVFGVDDDSNNRSFLKAIEASGGKTLFIEHKKNMKTNRSWIEFIQKNLSVEKLSKELKENNETYSLYDFKKLHIADPLFTKFESSINSIGITKLTKASYRNSLVTILRKIKSERDKKKLASIFNEFVFEKNKTVYLRGKNYYYWLPSYIFTDTRTIHEKWRDQMQFGRDALLILISHNVLHGWDKLSTEEKLIILAVIDHYKNAAIMALNTLCRSSIERAKPLPRRLLDQTETLTNEITSLYYHLVFDKPVDTKLLQTIIRQNHSGELLRMMRRYRHNHQGMRELDDPYTIALSVLSLFEQIRAKKIRYDLIIDFPCGGLELGMAYTAIFKLFYPSEEPPQLLHSFYSSKKRNRNVTKTKHQQEENWLLSFIPKHSQEKLYRALKNNQNILLYDNNVTTFSTLAEVKNYFRKFHNKKTDAVVGAVYYDNISRYLLGIDAEPLCKNWEKILDYQPIANYITAFNTWGTSQKGNILESIYFDKDKSRALIIKESSVKRTYPIFKACRVHNIYDLSLALQNGSNMIGIHAVYTNRSEYILGQINFSPKKAKRIYQSSLPITEYEYQSIQAMQWYIPAGMKQAIIFETSVSTSLMKETIKTYGLTNANLFVQLQHRTNAKYIRRIKQSITKNIILAIGAFQKDFERYFAMTQEILDAKTDFILIDLSKHQPDIISKNDAYHHVDKIDLLEKLAPLLKKNTIPILLADDVTVSVMKKYLRTLKENGISIAGIDMQNNLELTKNEQRYRIISDSKTNYQIRIRKSADKFYPWRSFSNSKFFTTIDKK